MASSGGEFYNDAQNLKALVQMMESEQRHQYQTFGHNRIEPAFVDRVFVVYECLGRDRNDALRPPKVLTTVRVVGFSCEHSDGCRVRLCDEANNRTMTVGHMPTKLWDYGVYVSIPTRVTVKWDAREARDNSQLTWSLMFAIFVKCADDSKWFSKGNHYMETINKMKALWPDFELATC